MNESGNSSNGPLRRAKSGEHDAFQSLVEPHRRQLHNHCYRMLGSFLDAEDAVQETFLRCWRSIGSFEGRSSVASWLYRIATNVCLDTLRGRSRRLLPQDAYPASSPDTPPSPAVGEIPWLEPYPSALVSHDSPETLAVSGEGITLAFVAVLQTLPPRQRAILLLMDVLDWRAKEVADYLGGTEQAVNSALRRARVRMKSRYHGSSPGAEDTTTSDLAKDDRGGEKRRLLDRYVAAWRNADPIALAELLREDAQFSMPPVPVWYRGRDNIVAALGGGVFAGAASGRWLLIPSSANLQPAYAVYQRDESGAYQPFGIQVVSIRAGYVDSVTTFLDTRLFPFFDMSESISASAAEDYWSK